MSGSTEDVRKVVIGIVILLAGVAFVLVFLVLTGIIAEPETVIENIARTLSGG